MADAAVPSVMRAWQYSSRDRTPEAISLVTDRPVPRPGRGEVLVRVAAASINPVDWKLQQGMLPFLPLRFPAVPLMDVAGDVVECGPGATKYSKGDAVFGTTGPMLMGGLAEYCLLKESTSAPRPAAVSAEVAAALPIAGLTALQALRDSAGLPLPRAAGEEVAGGYQGRVLVANASGGVGHLAVQLAKLAGAHVTATAGARNLDFVKQLGADTALDYKTPEGQQLAPTVPPAPADRYSAIVDGTHSLAAADVDKVLASPGKWLHLTPPVSVIALTAWRLATFSSKRVVPIIMAARGSDLEVLAALTAKEQLKVRIDEAVPFDKAREAWEKSLAGHVVGKVVVKME